jgi:hypothetical protein
MYTQYKATDNDAWGLAGRLVPDIRDPRHSCLGRILGSLRRPFNVLCFPAIPAKNSSLPLFSDKFFWQTDWRDSLRPERMDHEARF